MRWIFENNHYPKNLLELYEKELCVSPAIAQLLAAHEFQDLKQAQKFLNPRLADIENPSLIENLDLAVKTIQTAFETSKKIAVVSDYDVDGITSLALLSRFCEALGYHFQPFFPNREQEGYGLSTKIVQRVLDTGKYDLLIALDCGTNSNDAIEQLFAQNMQIVVIDHHQHNCEMLPKAILVNPHVHPQKNPISSQQLCTVGLVFKVLHAWLKKLKQAGLDLPIKLSQYLDLVALGTIADLVPLQNENRIFVSYGLKQLKKTNNPGLKSLLEVAEIDTQEVIAVDDIAFRIAPRINVSGRLSSADLPFKLLLHPRIEDCRIWAKELNYLNIERQKIEKQITRQADNIIQAKPSSLAYVLYHSDWHAGVVGIVAGKLSRKYYRPVFVLGKQNDVCKGSGRGIPEINLVELIQNSQAPIEQWGGHPAAVGLSISPQKVDMVEKALNDYLKQEFPQGLPEPSLTITAEIHCNQFSESIMHQLDLLAPFGQGNSAPIFALKNIILTKKPERFGQNGNHLRFKVNNLTVVGWNMGHMHLPLQVPIHLAITLHWNYWQNERSVLIEMLDWETEL